MVHSASRNSRGFFSIVLILVLGYAAIAAARDGLADLYAQPAKSFLQAKRDPYETLTETERLAIQTNLLAALG